MDQFKLTGVLWRMLFALVLVFATFNPTGHSYYHWLAGTFPSFTPVEAIAGVLLLATWIFFIRSTLASIGALGVVLMLALFAAIEVPPAGQRRAATG